MRALWAVALFLIPAVTAGFGDHDENGFPIGEGGVSHAPARHWTLAEAGDPLNQVGPATIYPYYPIVTAEVQRLAMDHPDRVKLHSAGKSTLGLDLWILEIGNFADEQKDGFVAWEDREVVWLDGGTHSNEYSGVYFVLAVAQYLVESYGSDDWATWVVDNRHTWIMPMVNPDGSHLMGRLNANLVNINRNYPVIWGGAGTDATLNNPGPEAGSEIETQINIEWFNITRPDYYASIHCCGNLWLFPYGEDGYDPADVDMMNRVCDLGFPAEIRDSCGPIWSTIYPASGSSVDTAYEYTGAVSFGFEMSGRSNLVGPWGEPVTFAEVFAQEAESWQGVQHAFNEVHRYGAYLEITDIDSDDASLFITVQNTGLGNGTGGVLKYRGEQVLDIVQYGHADIPALAAGETATIQVNGARDGGANWLNLDYAKRIWHNSNVRYDEVPVQIWENDHAELVEGVWHVPTQANAAAPAVVDSVDVPGMPIVVVLGLLVMLARRR